MTNEDRAALLEMMGIPEDQAEQVWNDAKVLVDRVTYGSGATKDDRFKTRVDLVPVVPLLSIADVFTYGARKYADRNWEKGFPYSRIYGALLRHVFAWWNGEEIDPESGMSHLAHAGCDLLMLMEYEARGTGEDDRPHTNKA